jgi:hypothetical protein
MQVLRASVLVLGSVLATLLALEVASGRILKNSPKTRFPCAWCAQLQGLHSTGPGPYGIEPPEPQEHPPGPSIIVPELDPARDWPTKAGRATMRAGTLVGLPGGPYLVERHRPNGQLIYRAHYSYDAFNRRVVTEPVRAATPRKFFMFLGCSFTLGEGLDEPQTLPSQFAKLAPEYKVYNYGFQGYSPADLYLRMLDADLRKEVPEKQGVAVYIYIDDHLNRVLGTMSHAAWGGDRPYVAEGPGGELRYRGDFQHGRPWLTSLYQFLWSSQLVQLLDIDIPPWLSDRHFKFFTHVVRGMHEQIESKLGPTPFYVVFWPGMVTEGLVAPYLDASGIHYLDLSHWDIGRLTGGRFHIPYDTHPSPEANAVIARALAAELKGKP